VLVLTRRNGESFFVSRDIRIKVQSVKGNQVRIVVDAPDGLPVYREEVRDQFESVDSPRIAIVGPSVAAAVNVEGLEMTNGCSD